MNLDLNLVRVFDTLMELRSVTRAADRLGLTQSAVSHALGRLRRALDDPLFLRDAHGLRPTARASAMAGGVREGLQRISHTLAPSLGENEDRRRFTLAAHAYFCALLIPPLIARTRAEAPALSLRVVPSDGLLVSALDRGDIDLAFGTFSHAPGRLIVEPLFQDELVWIAAARSEEALLPFDLERVLLRPRVVIEARRPFDTASPAEGDLASVYAAPAAVFGEATVVYDSQTAVALVAATDLVALVPRRIADRAPHTVAILGSGNERPLPLTMVWHARQRADPAFEKLRQLIHALV